jgi:hypothetical protein
MTRDDGFWLFAMVTMLRLNILLADAMMLKKGWTTFSDFARRNDWFAVLALCIEVAGLVGLGFHFWAKE